jgi:2-polyprenyl-6-methoxyphenol hydroxylase-like FAD-dependent oxidoreductase
MYIMKRTSLDADVSGSPFPQLTSLPQSKTESILSSIIQDEKNTKIHWKEILISYSEEDDHVIASLSTENGPKSIRGRYIIGADGSHSTVRKCDLSWKYEGYSAETKFALADVSLSGPGVDKLKNKYNIFYHSDGMCLVIPIKYEHDDNNLFRIIANMGPYDKREMKNQDIVTHGICKAENDTLSLEQVNEVITTRTENLGLVAKNPKWITHFHINERKANGYRRGRAFLMGGNFHLFFFFYK